MEAVLVADPDMPSLWTAAVGQGNGRRQKGCATVVVGGGGGGAAAAGEFAVDDVVLVAAHTQCDAP